MNKPFMDCLSVGGRLISSLALIVASPAFGGDRVALAADAQPLYQNDFEKGAVGTVPEDFMVLEGAFKVQQEGGNKFLELPGAPLDTYGLLFSSTEKDGLAVSARIFGTSKGRRFPTFAVGLNGGGGFKLQVSPAKGAIELLKGDTIRKSVPYDWPQGKWVYLRLEIQQSKSGVWNVAGKVWRVGEPEPAAASIMSEEKDEPTPGRASIWGSPFSGTPIRYDDLAVVRLPSQP